MKWWRRWRRDVDAKRAAAAARQAQLRLDRARRDWPRVRETHDRLAEWLDQALRG